MLQKTLCALCLLSFFAMAFPSEAWSQDKDESAGEIDKLRSLIAEATRLAFEGKYDEAINRYFEAKTLRDDPRLDFNIARCYHKKGDCSSAVKFYSVLIERSDAAPEDLKDARRYVSELGTCSVAKDPEVVKNPDKGKVVTPPPGGGEGNDKGMSTQSLIGWGSTITGGVLLISGFGLDIGSTGLQDDYETAAKSGDLATFNQLRADIDTRQSTIYGFYGAGAALTLTGIVLLITDDEEQNSSETTLQWSPVLAPGHAGASLHLKF